MSRITTIVTQKGGVGKTTTAQALTEGLKRRGFSVLLIDCDQQQNSTKGFRADPERGGVYEAMKGANAAEYIQRSPWGDILPASDSLIGADMQFAGKLNALEDAIKPLRRAYDHIIIDTPPTISAVTLAAIAASTDLVIPIEAAFYSVQGLEQLLYYLDRIRSATAYRPQIAGLLFTKFNERKKLAKQYRAALDQKAAALGLQVYKTEIRLSASVEKAQALTVGLFEYDKRCPAAKDYSAFIDEYLEQENTTDTTDTANT